MSGFDNKGDLKAAVLSFLSEKELDDIIAERLIALADTDIKLDVGIPSLERLDTVEIADGDDESTVPDRFLGNVKRVSYVYNDVTYYPKQVASERIVELKNTTDKFPLYFAIEGRDDADKVFVWAPTPGITVEASVVYLADGSLLEDDDTNYLLLTYPGLYLYGALKHAEAYVRDEGKLTTWASMYDAIAAKIEEAETRRLADGPIPPVRSAYGN